MKTLIFLNPRKHHKKGRRHHRRHHRAMKMNPHRRHRRGRRMRRNPASRGGFFSRSSGIVGAVKETFSKNLLMTGAGVILAPSLSKWVVDTFGPKVKT